MSWLSTPRAALLAGALASVIHVDSLRNDWALDDHPVIARNPAAHSPGAALAAAFSPYWPPEDGLSAGLYRPLTVLSYGVDWAFSGGRPWWFHLVNVLLHGAVTGLVVLVAAAWLPPVGTLVAGLVFAVHPVHVEAVANVVGRAELLAAGWLLLAILAARRYRSAFHGSRRWWLGLTVLAAVAAQLSKEHGVVAIALLGLDHVLERSRPGQAPRPSAADLYLSVAAATIAYLYLWQAVSGDFVAAAAVAPLRNLTTTQRLAAVLPVQLDVLRLLVWPWDLAPEYGPQTIPVRESWTWIAALGGAVTMAIMTLGVLVVRRAPAVSFGLLAAGLAYAPTSNLGFVSGVVLAERSLYLSVLAPAMVLGWLVASGGQRQLRLAAAGLSVLLVVSYAVRTVTRVPFWRDTRTVVVEGFISHPESFAAHVRLARAREQTGDVQGAIAQYMAANAIYDGYSFVPVRAARLALGSGRVTLARDLARMAAATDPHHPEVARVTSQVLLALGEKDSSLAVLRNAIEAQPLNVPALESYVTALDSIGAADWQRYLAHARLFWRRGLPVSASAALDSAFGRLSRGPFSRGECWELVQSAELSATLNPNLAREIETIASDSSWRCMIDVK